MTDAELLMNLFKGSDMSYGRTETGKTTNAKGKVESRSWTEKVPAKPLDFEQHIAGTKGIGIPPINSKNQVHWGAIDVDQYNGLSLEELNQTLQTHRLPLVLCRSKSGGPHLFLFCTDWVPATLMIEKLDALAGFLGFGTSEIYPKQGSIGMHDKSPDYGSWINLPYFGGTSYFRYGFDEKGQAIQTIPEFVKYALSRALDPKQLQDYVTPVAGDLLPDGPPCLNQMLAQGVDDFRNVILSNVAVYLKKASPDNWQERLDEINRAFKDPLQSREVETIKGSYSKKEYRYQCSKEPLCRFCNSSLCKQRKHGIGGSDLLPVGRSLSMIKTDPPIWYLDLEMTNGNRVRISLTTDELQNPRAFQKRCMETIQQMPPLLKAEEWQEVVQKLMSHCAIIEMPPEMNPVGQFKELLDEFLSQRGTKTSMEDMLRGLAFRDAYGYHFRMKDLSQFLTQQRFTMPGNRVLAILKDLGAQKGFVNFSGKGINHWVLPIGTEAPVTEIPTTKDEASNAY